MLSQTEIEKRVEVFSREYGALAKYRKLVGALKAEFQPHQTHHSILLNRKSNTFKVTHYPAAAPIAHRRLQPTIVFIPGTAFMANEESYTHAIAHLLTYSGCQVLVFRPPLAPEYTLDEATVDLLDQLDYAINFCNKKLRIDPDNIMLAGYSSGGTYAVLVSFFATCRNLFKVKRQILLSPVLNLSRDKAADYTDKEQRDPTISLSFVQRMLKACLPQSHGSRLSKRLLQISKRAQNFSKDLCSDFLIGEFDRFASDAESYHQTLKKIGLPTHLIQLKDQDHGFAWKCYEGLQCYVKALKTSLGYDSIPKTMSLPKKLLPSEQRLANQKDSKATEPVCTLG